jgi:hypothetical protein
MIKEVIPGPGHQIKRRIIEMKSKFIWVLGILLVLGFIFAACDNGGTSSSSTGTIRIRVIGIPANVISAGKSGNILVGIGPANALKADGSNALAGRDTELSSSEDSFGDDWYEFTMYNVSDYNQYVGPSGNYDIGFINYSNNEIKILRNKRLEANSINTIGYGSFVDF